MAKMSVLLFWVVISCGFVHRYLCFEETYGLHPQPYGIISMSMSGVGTQGNPCTATIS
jgi:hypothetical protein